MKQKIKLGAVSYLNAKPLIYGFQQGMMQDEIDLIIDYPAKIAEMLQQGSIDVGLIPVASIPALKEHHIVSDYGIACDGEVASVCLFSEVPLQEIKTILLDYQSRTSVELLKILLTDHWKICPQLIDGVDNFETKISETTAGLVIGDRAFDQRLKSKYIYDLGLAWKALTGLPFVFAAWVSNKPVSEAFITAFNEANAYGYLHLDEVIGENGITAFDIKSYYTQFVKFKLDTEMKEAKALFLSKLNK